MPTGKKVDFTAATARARHIRELYNRLEERLHGSAWTPQEVMLGYSTILVSSAGWSWQRKIDGCTKVICPGNWKTRFRSACGGCWSLSPGR